MSNQPQRPPRPNTRSTLANDEHLMSSHPAEPNADSIEGFEAGQYSGAKPKHIPIDNGSNPVWVKDIPESMKGPNPLLNGDEIQNQPHQILSCQGSDTQANGARVANKRHVEEGRSLDGAQAVDNDL